MKYTKKPVTITALKWDGTEERFQEIKALAPAGALINRTHEGKIEIPTLEGVLTADLGDMVIQGIKGELYPCKPDIFDASYVPAETYPTTGLDFGEAINALKAGFKVARSGWNGKNMFLILNGGYSVPADKARPDNHIDQKFLESRGCGSLDILPHIDMWTAQNNLCVGWLASQTDMLATDWEIVQ
jgi:Protein of unknown function (DUF2829)